MIDLNFLISAVIAQIFNRTAELKMNIETPTNETNAETEAHQLTAETKKIAQRNLKLFILFYAFHSLNHYAF